MEKIRIINIHREREIFEKKEIFLSLGRACVGGEIGSLITGEDKSSLPVHTHTSSAKLFFLFFSVIFRVKSGAGSEKAGEKDPKN